MADTETQVADESITEKGVDTVTTEAQAAEVAQSDAGTQASQQSAIQSTANPTGGGSGTQAEVRPAIDIDAELNAKDMLAERLEKGLIDFPEYNREVSKHDKNITKAQREMLEPAKEIKRQSDVEKANQRYFSTWGQGSDIAQAKFGKTIAGPVALKAWNDAQAEALADPTFNRPGYDLDTVIKVKWMQKLETESKKTGQSARTTPAPAGTRISGSTATSIPANTRPQKTARQKLNDGDYGDLAGEMKELL